jgi:8-oxo-dGTP diphosphatase
MSVVHVAVGVIRNAQGRILISLRHPDSHQGGLWEFPGGKVEAGETLQQAMQRELLEELGIEVHTLEPLLEIHHDYGDKKVFLDIWVVTAFSGEARGREGQAIKWVGLEELQDYEFPAANVPIIERLLLFR